MNQKTTENRVLSKPWRIRAAQLDLARQRETLETIEQYIRFIKEWGYNTLLLYLEGVVRTKSFPYRPASQSYTLDDMRRVVKAASRAGIDVIPCVSTLGHTEHFLTCKQLAHLGEKTLTPKPLMFCPSNDDVYQFLSRYLGEIADIFPSKHFHIGCDESWALGSCPTCRERLAKGEIVEDLVLKHIVRVRSILQKHGKRAWIWDDMFENTTEAKIKELPRDVVMCAWHYGSELVDHGSLPGHFNNLRRRDWFSFYEKAGFDAVACPWANYFENALALTEIAKQRRVFGGLQTVWELGASFLPAVLPGVALTAAMWSQPSRSGEKVAEETIRKLFPSAGSLVRDALRGCLIDLVWWHNHGPQYYLRGPMTLGERRHLRTLIVYEQIIRNHLATMVQGQERDIVEDLHVLLRLQIVAGRQRQLLPALVDPRIKLVDRVEQKKMVDWCLQEFDAIADIRAEQWKRYRPGIHPDTASGNYRNLKKNLASFIRNAETTPTAERALLNVRLFLWDSYSAPLLKIELFAKGKWRPICRQNFKPVNHRDALYTLQVPVRWKSGDPERVRFTVSGFGGQGVSYAELCFANRTLVPVAVIAAKGSVSDPTALLQDDSTVCFLGSTDTVHTLHHQLSDIESSVEVTLAPKGKLSGPKL